MLTRIPRHPLQIEKPEWSGPKAPRESAGPTELYGAECFMKIKTDLLQWKVRLAIQRLHKKYHKHPWIFMSEADVQCNLYSELLKCSVKPRKTIVKDCNDKKTWDGQYQLLTRPLHAELSSSRRNSTEFVDLCLIDPTKTTFWIKKSKFNRWSKDIPVWSWEWRPKDAIGIEIKFNPWIIKKQAFSHDTKRERVTQNWKDYRWRLVRDFKKLKRYKRGWLIFVDQHSLINSRKEWRDFVDDVIRDSNYGYAKKTLNAYYLCPKIKTAFSYKSPGNSF